MTIRDLMRRLAAAEADLRDRRFLAPCVPGATLRVRVEGLVHAFRPNPPGFAGWGLFQPIDAARAQLVARPEPRDLERYLGSLPLARLHALMPAKGKAWWAWPVSEEGFGARFRRRGPLPVHLTKGLAPFETLRARFDGASFWFEGLERFADPVLPEQLREARAAGASAEELRAPGLTPELRDAYAWRHAVEEAKRVAKARASLEGRLGQALEVGGGKLDTYRERDGDLVVEWRDRLGRRHVSSLSKSAFDVRTAGAICLQGRDADFDLASLVGVMSTAPEGYYYEGDLGGV